MSPWEGLLFALAVIVGVRALTSMMRARRDRLIGEVQVQVDAHRAAQKKKRREEQSEEIIA